MSVNIIIMCERNENIFEIVGIVEMYQLCLHTNCSLIYFRITYHICTKRRRFALLDYIEKIPQKSLSVYHPVKYIFCRCLDPNCKE